MAEIALQCPGVVALIGQSETAGVPEHVGVSLETKLCGLTSALHHPGKTGGRERRAALLVNTNGDFGSCSRCSRRRARNSSPRIGCVAGEPFLTRRTASVAASKSIWSHRRSTSSLARNPCSVDKPARELFWQLPIE
jgi:hypothetical protein